MTSPSPYSDRSLRIRRFGNRYRNLLLVILPIGLWLFWPVRLPQSPLSSLLLDSRGQLLEARIASDGQWRFPPLDDIPPKVEQAVLTFEDRWFYWHPGVNPVSLIGALTANLRAGKVVRGGSTITMQVIRLARLGQPRTFREKALESLTAIRLSFQWRKKTVLQAYLSRAPFGGNVVGLDAAAWRYFGKPARLLSWGEAATLAVLPNSPALIHPGRNREQLRLKRNRLLDRLVARGALDALDGDLAKLEPIPEAPLPLPHRAPELMTTLANVSGGVTGTTLEGTLQDRVREVLARHREVLSGNGIHNMAAILVRNADRHVLAYAGNTPGPGIPGGDVDILRAPRSPGSTLKPLLYAAALDDGLIWPHSLIPDIPTQYGSYRPENYDRRYQGIVPASEAIASSLNIPMVRLLRKFGIEPFLQLLRRAGLSTLDRPADHYGLSLILGGGEVTLWQLVQVYAVAAGLLGSSSDRVRTDNLPGLVIRPMTGPEDPPLSMSGTGALWGMAEAMRQPERPEGQENWSYFASSRQVAWKTGTSFGFRDGWAIGFTPEYTIGVWTGNANGEARPDLVGIKTAAPILFELFDLLPPTSWFLPPYQDLEIRVACGFSGDTPTTLCPRDTLLVPNRHRRPSPCAMHRKILIDPETGLRVVPECRESLMAREDVVAILPPLQEYFYHQRHPEFRRLPPLAQGCLEPDDLSPLQWVYPSGFTRIILPVDLDGHRQDLLLRATHRFPGETVYWHMDGKFLGETRGPHEWVCQPGPGRHQLLIEDRRGNRSLAEIDVAQ